jgi:hypothetical protein
MLIEEYVDHLDRALTGPPRLKSDLVTEARHGLSDAAEGYREAGLPTADAERQAVAEFGAVRELAPAYQAELAAGAARRLTLRLALATALLGPLAQLMWWRAPWADSTIELPGGYRLLSDAQDRLGPTVLVLALVAYVLLRRSSRRGLTLAASVGVASLLTLNVLSGVLLFVWSALLWDAALTWPPMVLGGLVLATVYAWLGRSAATCVAAARAA